MSAFHDALSDFLRKHQVELQIADAAGDDDLGPDHKAASIKGQEAFDRLFTMPAENASQAAAKMAALAAYYEVAADTGCGAKGWALLVAEVVRFSVGQPMAAADDRAASATLVTAWDLVRGEIAAGGPVTDQWEAAEDMILRTPALSPAGVRAKLAVVLDHLLDKPWHKPLLAADDIGALHDRESELDFVPRMIVSAIQALEGMSA